MRRAPCCNQGSVVVLLQGSVGEGPAEQERAAHLSSSRRQCCSRCSRSSWAALSASSARDRACESATPCCWHATSASARSKGARRCGVGPDARSAPGPGSGAAAAPPRTLQVLARALPGQHGVLSCCKDCLCLPRRARRALGCVLMHGRLHACLEQLPLERPAPLPPHEGCSAAQRGQLLPLRGGQAHDVLLRCARRLRDLVATSRHRARVASPAQGLSGC